MPTGVYIRTKPVSAETRKKMSERMKGNKYTLGMKLSKEHIEKIVKGRTGCKHSEETKKKVSQNHAKFWKGKKMSNEHRKKLSEAHKGVKGSGWKGGINPINDTIRKSIEYRLRREAVFARDNWTCKKSGEQGGRLVAHHIQNFSNNEDLRFAIDNGITLSKKEYTIFHKKYGYKNNTREQLDEFLTEQIQ